MSKWNDKNEEPNQTDILVVKAIDEKEYKCLYFGNGEFVTKINNEPYIVKAKKWRYANKSEQEAFKMNLTLQKGGIYHHKPQEKK